MKINIYNNYGEINFAYMNILKKLEDIFTKELKVKKRLSIILVDLKEIHRINKEYRHIDRPTDVISFEDDDKNYLGDIFICVEKAKLQAEEYNHSIEREFAFLACHGILHLLGYDHQNKDEEEKMFAKQEEILNIAGYKR